MTMDDSYKCRYCKEYIKDSNTANHTCEEGSHNINKASGRKDGS